MWGWERLFQELETFLTAANREIESASRDVESSRSSGRFMYHVPCTKYRSVCRGRPQVFISEDQLIYLRSLNFSWSQIAEVLGVSRMIIYRRRMDLGIVDTQDTSQLTDAELQSLLQQLRRTMANMGETLVIGHLRSLGHVVTRQRVCNAIHATDPLNTTFR